MRALVAVSGIVPSSGALSTISEKRAPAIAVAADTFRSADCSPTERALPDHGGEGRLGRDLALDDPLAGELPDVGPALDLLDMQLQAVTRHDRPAEAHVVDRHEIDELAVRL